MACVGYVLSVLPVEAIMEDLNVLLTPHITELQQLGEQQVSAHRTSTSLW